MAQDTRERTKTVLELLRSHFNVESHTFMRSGSRIHVKIDRLTTGNQEAAFRKLHAEGYRLNRFGEFSTGTEFAEFVIAD